MVFSLFPRLVKRQYNPLAMVVLSFLLVIIAGTLFLMLPVASRQRAWTPALDAAFTATSATTVTGLAVFDTGTHWSFFGQFIILLLVQIGGLGYMTIIASLLILVRKRSITEALLLGESLNTYSFKEMFALAKSLFMVVILFEALGALTLFVNWVPRMGTVRAAWYGLFHSVTAFNNAGFDLMGGLTTSVGDPIVNITVIGLIVSGGVGFFVLMELVHWTFGKARLSLHAKVVLLSTCFLILAGAVLLFLLEFDNQDTLGKLPLETKAWAALFQSVTARTAGFNTIPIEQLTDASLLLIILFMFIGASPGGTGGGVKTTTAALVFFTVISYLKGRKDSIIGNRSIDDITVRKGFAVIVLAIGFITCFTLLLLILEQRGFLSTFFEVTSAFGTVGLTTGITPHLGPFAKGILMVTMFVGRIGSLSMILLFARGHVSRIRFPKEQLSIG
ncbi:Trk family potassium uptake protein [Candidatus Woesearchaeota archaeon]|nr:Trk family potassium uptake protein [Candidatus Woesearchaeota archaeon]